MKTKHSLIKPLCFIALLMCVGLFVAHPVFAQQIDLKSFAENAGFSTGPSIQVIIARLIRTAISFVGVIAVVFVLYGGFVYMTAGGNSERIKKAKGILINAFIGLILVFASFAIVQFLLGSIMKATGTTSSENAGGGSSSFVSPSKPVFYLSSLNTDCAIALRNFKLQFVFSKPIKLNQQSQVEGIVIRKKSDQSVVKGTFSVFGKRVEFSPESGCSGEQNASIHCFDANTDYSVELNASKLTSATGFNLSCTQKYPCSFSFTSGSGVDLTEPNVSFVSPKSGQTVFVGENEKLEAKTQDDTGVSSVDFFAIDGSVPIFSAGLNFSTEQKLSGQQRVNYFFTDVAEEWNTNGYVPNKSYFVWAEGKDCAGNLKSSERVSVKVRAPNCNNDVQDKDLGETDIDCGGEPSQEYYCGACADALCQDNSECASGSCVNGFCKVVPVISSVTPGDGAVGNLITISGKGFGSVPGSIQFLGKTEADIVEVGAFQCNGSIDWSSKQVIVQIPENAKDGPIQLNTSDKNIFDTTKDDNGPIFSDFDVNKMKRPGLCSINPSSEFVNQSVVLNGLGFGSKQNTSEVYFANFLAGSYVDWKENSVIVGVPNITEGKYQTQLFSGDAHCVNAKNEVLKDKICVSNTSCNVVAGEFCGASVCTGNLAYCKTNADCGFDGACESVRVGSNTIGFSAKTSKSSEKPIISYIDSGWKMCVGGTGGGKKCTKDDQCGGGKCADAKDSGPIDQYITIYGTGFGSAKGIVKFVNLASGNFAVGSTDFPKVCGSDFWHDTSITVKVPSEYETSDKKPVTFDKHNLVVVPGSVGSGPSDPKQFTVVNDKPGPSICLVEPKSGPIGTKIEIKGERFGSEKGSVVFTPDKIAGYTIWQPDYLGDVGVPEGSKTGPVFVKDNTQNISNSINFAVGNCKETPTICSANTSCCADGTCSSECTAKNNKSTFAYTISTGVIPVSPVVLTQCDKNVISPSPSLNWSQPENICINAAVKAAFSMKMDQTTFTDNNILVQACVLGKENNSICEQWEDPMKSGSISTNEIGFSWIPKNLFEENRLYQVTLKSKGQGSIGIKSHKDKGGAYLEKDFVWKFRTSKSTDLCDVGGVNVSPSSFTETKMNELIDYEAELISKKDKCVTLSCNGYSIGWSSSFLGATVVNENPPISQCINQVKAIEETPDGNPAKIEAVVTNTVNKPSDIGLLTIDFTDPTISDFFPSCSESCINVLPWVKFTADILPSSLKQGTVQLYECQDSLCASNEVKDVSKDILSGSIGYLAQKAMLNFKNATTKLKQNTWYRVVLDGSIVSTSNVPLSKSGSNFGTEQNKYYKQSFSWKFKTKDLNISCGVDRISVTPKEQVLTYVGERQEFGAIAYGSPDICSATGQSLQESGYSWSPWSAIDTPNNVGVSGIPGNLSEMVAFLIKNGSISRSLNSLPTYCSSSCTNTGSSLNTSQAICGNGKFEKGEDCDDGNILNGDGCSNQCISDGTVVCSGNNKIGCCGNGKLEKGEQCDDSNVKSGDGCSKVCKNEGSITVGSSCGDGVIDHSVISGGESCDDGNVSDKDGCSSVCLHEGSVSEDSVYSVCGNGIKESGEDCDDGNILNKDGCSSVCLNEGTFVCTKSNNVNCCGNGKSDVGEESTCDVQGGLSQGCSSYCTKLGSSAFYSEPSFCGDGVFGVGESCETSPESVKKIGGYSVAQIATGAQAEVDEKTGYAVSTVTASAEGKSGSAIVKLQCVCGTDQSCGANTTIGCGVKHCCFERPKLITSSPVNLTANVCRNTAIWVEFNQPMDSKSFGSIDKNNDGKIDSDEFNPNLQLQLAKLNGVPIVETTCPIDYQKVVYETKTGGNIFAKTWNWVKNAVLSLFGKDVKAASFKCLVPVKYEEVLSKTTDRVYLRLSNLLEQNGEYILRTISDYNTTDESQDGVLSKNHVSLCIGNNCYLNGSQNTFTVGSEICTLDKVDVTDTGKTIVLPTDSPSANYFTKKGEEHHLIAKAFTIRKSTGDIQEISSIPGIYSWEWGWSSGVVDSDSKTNIVHNKDVSPAPNEPFADFYAEGNNGEESVLATASVTDKTVPTKTNTFDAVGMTMMTAFLCENPWPENIPFLEKNKNTNYSFFYCRDFGKQGTEEDLPSLIQTPEYSSLDTNIIQESIFTVQGTKDAIGIRVMKNPDYLSPIAWYQSKGFSDSTKSISLDGYDAVQAGTTIYAAAANQSGSILYPNMYILSYNPDAGKEAKQIFNAVLQNFRLNGNTDVISDVKLCKQGNGYVKNKEGGYLSCFWDGDCVDVCVPSKTKGENGTCSVSTDSCLQDSDCPLSPQNVGVVPVFCNAGKTKLIRDTKRLSDISDIVSKIETLGSTNKHCSVAKNKSCQKNTDCSGTETCVSGYPTIQTGTLIPSISNSIWSSWNSVLGNALQFALPIDPINKFWLDCKDKQKDGFDPSSCWNGQKGQFVCPDQSHLYGYRSFGGEDYTLYSQFEYTGGFWVNNVDKSKSDHVTVRVEYPKQTESTVPSTGNLSSGFFQGINAEFCGSATAWGVGGVCGDGTIAGNETCEKGNVKSVSCDGGKGTMTVSCPSNCQWYANDTEAESAGKAAGAACVSISCGNGVKEGLEKCDDGKLNGSYGHCNKTCDGTSFVCGDGYLAGSEQCDCGTPDTFSSVMKKVDSWANKHACAGSNGQYFASGTTCTYDCKLPGPTCGDKIIQDSEQCDGGQEEYSGFLCMDGISKCTNNSDCPKGFTCGGFKQGYNECGSGTICVGGDKSGKKCLNDSECTKGTCSKIQYSLTRTRTCKNPPAANACAWETWSSCEGGIQKCGNGKMEGDEKCDDGNTSNFDSCTNTCKKNVCGDNYINVGVESCDNGENNGTVCSLQYGSACTYCDKSCQYKTASGEYCGDEKINGNEFCDGKNIPYSCFKSKPNEQGGDVKGTCNKEDEGKIGDQGGYSGCPKDYTCRFIGVCNGGTTNQENGKPCTVSGSILLGDKDITTNINWCDGGECVPPVCADNCQSSCPLSFKTIQVQIQGNTVGSNPSDSVELYSHGNGKGSMPDSASLLLPACRVLNGITANISSETVIPSNLDVVFVTEHFSDQQTLKDEKNSIKSLIENVFTTGGKLGMVTRIGLVSFETVNKSPSAIIDSELKGSDNNNALQNIVSTYKGGGTELSVAKGIETGISLFQKSENAMKFLILSTNDFTTHSLNGTECKKFTFNYGGVAYSGNDACIAEVRFGLMQKYPDIAFYLVSRHSSEDWNKISSFMSSESCNGLLPINVEKVLGCQTSGTYAFFDYTKTTDEVYSLLKDGLNYSIQNPNSAIVKTRGIDFQSKPVETSSSVLFGNDTKLPLSNSFACITGNKDLPIDLTFPQTGTVKIGNINVSYCPVN